MHVRFPSSGTVRLMYLDALLGYVDPLQLHPAYSRGVQVTVG